MRTGSRGPNARGASRRAWSPWSGCVSRRAGVGLPGRAFALADRSRSGSGLRSAPPRCSPDGLRSPSARCAKLAGRLSSASLLPAGRADRHPAVVARRTRDVAAVAELVSQLARVAAAADDLAERGDLGLRVIGVQAVEDDLHVLLCGEHIQDQRREREQLADALDRLDREARYLELGEFEPVF